MGRHTFAVLSLILVSVFAFSASGVRAAETPTCGGLPADYVGTAGDDRITAARKPGMPLNRIVVVVAGAGNDTIYGADFTSAYICGNEGNDTIIGRNSTYRIYGGKGDDTIVGGPNPDYIEGNLGRDNINGGNGGDTIYGNEDNDTLRGSCDQGVGYSCIGSTDRIYGGQGDDTMYGGSGNDYLYGNLGIDKAYGGSNANRNSPDFDDCYSSEVTGGCERVFP